MSTNLTDRCVSMTMTVSMAMTVPLCSLQTETDQHADHEGEHENREPSSQHEEEPGSADHSL